MAGCTVTEQRTLRARRAAAALAVQWQYPRPITELEVRTGRWWSTPDGVGWLIWGVSPHEVHMHGVGRPGADRRVITRELTPVILEAARSMGATRVTQPLGWGEHTPEREGRKMRALVRLWVRAGWKLDEFGMPFMEVG